jgi:hypothetical protein
MSTDQQAWPQSSAGESGRAGAEEEEEEERGLSSGAVAKHQWVWRLRSPPRGSADMRVFFKTHRRRKGSEGSNTLAPSLVLLAHAQLARVHFKYSKPLLPSVILC